MIAVVPRDHRLPRGPRKPSSNCRTVRRRTRAPGSRTPMPLRYGTEAAKVRAVRKAKYPRGRSLPPRWGSYRLRPPSGSPDFYDCPLQQKKGANGPRKPPFRRKMAQSVQAFGARQPRGSGKMALGAFPVEGVKRPGFACAGPGPDYRPRARVVSNRASG